MDFNEWLDERERIHNSDPEEAPEFEWADDRYYAYPKLLTALRNVLELHRSASVYELNYYGGGEYCGHCRDEEGDPIRWPCDTYKAIQEAINE